MNAASKEKIFDIILADALKESMEREFKAVDEIVLDEPHEFSPKFERKMQKLMNSIGKKDRIKSFTRIGARAVITVAAIFGFIFVGLLTQPEVYASVQNVFRSVFDKYDKYEFGIGELTVENFDDSFRLGYVPEGYYISEGHYSPAYVSLIYTDGFGEENSKIMLSYGIADGLSISLDNEHHTYEEFTINGIEYKFYGSTDKDFLSNLLWYEDGYAFVLYAQLPKDELVKIAENLEK